MYTLAFIFPLIAVLLGSIRYVASYLKNIEGTAMQWSFKIYPLIVYFVSLLMILVTWVLSIQRELRPTHEVFIFNVLGWIIGALILWRIPSKHS